MLISVANIFEPIVILATAAGVFAGIVIGTLPGLTAVMGVSILVPFTFGMQAEMAIMLMLGVFTGAVYGGSISAILVQIPGTPSAIVTSLDGYPLCKQGKGGMAIGISTISSFIGAMFSTFVLALVAPLLSNVALVFSHAEYFALTIFGLTVIVSLSRGSMIKGLMAGTMGVLVATIGLDPISNVPRFTFGNVYMQSGMSFVPVMIGLFGLGEVLNQILSGQYHVFVEQNIKDVFPKAKDLFRMKWLYLRSAIIGTVIGALPGTGGPIAAILSYNEAQRGDPHPEEFGTGRIEGVAAPECSNNASVGGSLIPMLTLGIPGDATTAVMISAFMLHNLQCGPLLMINQPDILPTIFIGLMISNVFMLFFGFAFLKIFARLISFPQNYLIPILTLLTIIGAYTVSNLYFHILIMFIFGIIGLLMKRLEIPMTPMVLGLVLGGMMETNFRPALMSFKGNAWLFFSRPISCVLLVLAILFLCRPALVKLYYIIKNHKNNRNNLVRPVK